MVNAWRGVNVFLLCLCMALLIGILTGFASVLLVGNIAGSADWASDDARSAGKTQINITMSGSSADGDFAGRFLPTSGRDRPFGHVTRQADGFVSNTRIPPNVQLKTGLGSTYVPTGNDGLVEPPYLPKTVVLRAERGVANGTVPLDTEARIPRTHLSQRGGAESTTASGQPNGFPPLGQGTNGDEAGKVPLRHLPPGFGMAMRMLGTWNPVTNTPNVTSGVGQHGDMYLVSASGTRIVDNNSVWQKGNALVFDTHVWIQIEQTTAVISVNGKHGDVSLALSELTDVESIVYPYPSLFEGYYLGYSAGLGKWFLESPSRPASRAVMDRRLQGTVAIQDTYVSINVWIGLLPPRGSLINFSGVPAGQEGNFDVSDWGPSFYILQNAGSGLYYISAQLSLESISTIQHVCLAVTVNPELTSRHVGCFHVNWGSCVATNNARCHFPFWVNTVIDISFIGIEGWKLLYFSAFIQQDEGIGDYRRDLKMYSNTDMYNDNSMNGGSGYSRAGVSLTFFQAWRIA